MCYYLSGRIKFLIDGPIVPDRLISSRWIAFCLLCSLTLFACGVPVKQNRYQYIPRDLESSIGAVVELQQKAQQALAGENPQLAIDYLERAIKIEPRNAISWHYLAQSYYQQDNFDKCLAMLDRSMSYGNFSDRFEEAGRNLKKKCQAY